jgi:hypothetical protein
MTSSTQMGCEQHSVFLAKLLRPMFIVLGVGTYLDEAE